MEMLFWKYCFSSMEIFINRTPHCFSSYQYLIQVLRSSSAILMTAFNLQFLTVFSSDTIYALSTCCFLLNIIFHNYGNYSSLMFSPVSLNCAIFVSVLLASRLDGTLHTFTLVLLSFVFFAFAPKLTEKMQDTYPVQTVLFNIFAAVFACTCFLFISRAVFLLIVSLFIAILVFLPCLFVRMQSLKNTIHGPWDEAVLVVD